MGVVGLLFDTTMITSYNETEQRAVDTRDPQLFEAVHTMPLKPALVAVWMQLDRYVLLFKGEGNAYSNSPLHVRRLCPLFNRTTGALLPHAATANLTRE